MSSIKTVTESDFEREVLEAKQPVVVDFWADWCGPCHTIAPVIDELAKDFDGRAVVVKVNVDENKDLAARYSIRAIPSLLIFKDGQVVEQVAGVLPKKILAAKLDGFVAVA